MYYVENIDNKEQFTISFMADARSIRRNRLKTFLKANLHAAICQPDLSATINREANRFMYSASDAHAFFIVKTF